MSESKRDFTYVNSRMYALSGLDFIPYEYWYVPNPRGNQWFISGEGIAGEVITADIKRYLGPDAWVTKGESEGRPGFWITAYRTMTSQMLDDLRSTSARWQAELLIRGLPDPIETPTNPSPVSVKTSPTGLAEKCGWQIGAEKFLWNGEAETPLESKTTRGVLGRGGYGEVEEVRVPGHQEVMARKRFVISRTKKQATREHERIRIEAGNLMKLDHEHIVKVLGCYEVRIAIYEIRSIL
jgi:hypothetical protein